MIYPAVLTPLCSYFSSQEVGRIRITLWKETTKIQANRSQHKGEQQAPQANLAAPPKGSKGRPTDISKAGTAAGQKPLQWPSTAARQDGDVMEV